MSMINDFLLPGIFLGLAAGISPGPLLAMTISESIRYGPGEGIKVAASPLITDTLIVSLVMFLLLHLENQNDLMAFIGLCGAFYLFYLGISSLKFRNIRKDIENMKRRSLAKGVLVNFLSPHPYLFWISIGGPILFSALDVSIQGAFMFIAGFYTLLVGSKIAIAMAVGVSGSFLKSGYYQNTIRAMGLVYILFALIFLEQSLDLLCPSI